VYKSYCVPIVQKNDCDMIGMALHPWANFGVPCTKSIQISSKNPIF